MKLKPKPATLAPHGAALLSGSADAAANGPNRSLS